MLVVVVLAGFLCLALAEVDHPALLLSSALSRLTFDERRGLLRPTVSRGPSSLDEYDDTMGFLHFDSVAFSGNAAIHFFNMTDREKEFIRRLNARRQDILGGYRSFIGNRVDLIPPLKITHHPEALNVKDDCAVFLKVTGFLLSPFHADNLFHLHNNNLLAILQGIIRSPNCDPHSLHCEPPSRLFLLRSDAKRNQDATTASVMFKEIFDQPLDTARRLFGGTRRVCVSHLVWGRGLELAYYGKTTYPLTLARAVTDALWRKAHKRNDSTDNAISTDEQRPLRVVALTRNLCKDRRALNMETTGSALKRAASELGLAPVSFVHDQEFKTKNFEDLLRERFLTADVLVGTHGAGLTNILYCARGRVLIEIYPWRARSWQSRFRNLAWARGSLYISIQAKTQSASSKTLETSSALLKCALSIAVTFLRTKDVGARLCAAQKLSAEDLKLLRVNVPPPITTTNETDTISREGVITIPLSDYKYY